MVLIPRQAQTSINDFLNHLGTDNLSIYYQDELKYGQLNRRLVNQFSDSQFQDVLDTISDKSKDSKSDWEIRKGNTLLLDNNQNQFDLAIGLPQLQQGLKEGEFSLGQALTGYWLIEDELNDLSQASNHISYYSAMKTSMDLISSLEVNKTLLFSATQQSSVSEISQHKQNTNKQNISLSKSHENFVLPKDPKATQSLADSSADNDLSTQVDNSSIVGLEIDISHSNLSQDPFQLNEFNYLQYQAFLHHLFSQLAQQKKLRYYDGKAILTINDETLVAQLNEQNQWEYISGTLSQTSLNELQYELNSSPSIRHSSPSQSSDLTL